MTREDAIESLNEINETIFGGGLKSIPMAINALEQEPCEDAISRQEVLNIQRIVYKEYCRTDNEKALMEEIARLTHEVPTVTPNPKIGHWIKESPFMLSECSECGNKAFGYHGFDETRTDYCPNCGAKMEVER